MAQNGDEMRKQAVDSLHRKRSFKQYLATYVIVNVLVIAIWALSGRRYYWPVWVLFGTSIALAFSGWNANGSGNRIITDEQIDQEMKRLKGD